MQRVLVILSVTLLVVVSLGAGALAAHWPFWRRAWQWHAAVEGWPAQLAGAVQVLPAGDAPPLQFAPRAHLEDLAGAASTQVLMHAVAGEPVDAFLAPGFSADTQVDGRGLSAALLVPLFGVLREIHPGLLDRPVGAHLRMWREDRRGVITPRQLFWQLSGLPAGRFRPLNPFSARAQLASGPNFQRAALGWQPEWPPGSHFEPSPVNAQLLALVAGAVEGAAFAGVLERRLWSRAAAAEAVLLLDHLRGEAAAHCCVRATAADWLRLGLLLATDGAGQQGPLWSPGFVAEVLAASPVHPGYGLGFRLMALPEGEPALLLDSPGRQLLVAPHLRAAVLWIGEGDPPPALAQLFMNDAAIAARQRASAEVPR